MENGLIYIIEQSLKNKEKVEKMKKFFYNAKTIDLYSSWFIRTLSEEDKQKAKNNVVEYKTRRGSRRGKNYFTNNEEFVIEYFNFKGLIDINGNLSKSGFGALNPTRGIIKTITLFYNSEGNLKEIVNYRSSGFSDKKISITYDPPGRMIGERKKLW